MGTRAVSEHVHLIDASYHGKSGVLGTYLVKGERSMVVDPGPTVSAIIAHIEAHDDTLIDLRVERPSLEERFLEITGARGDQ